MVALNLPKFELGQIVSTPGALEALECSGQTADDFLASHQRGNWGIAGEDEKRANELALQDGSRIFSAYLLTSGEKLWVITEAVGDNGRRASTCVLLPHEY